MICWIGPPDERAMFEDWDLAGLAEAFLQRFGLHLDLEGGSTGKI